MANRFLKCPDDMAVPACAERVMSAFSKPHTPMRFTEKARITFVAAQAFYNVQSSTAATKGDISVSARWGAAPWHLGVLSSTLFAWDIFVGAAKAEEVFVDGVATIDGHHVERARRLLQILHGFLSIWQRDPLAEDPPHDVYALPAPGLLAEAIASQPLPAMAAFPATQAAAPKVALPSGSADAAEEAPVKCPSQGIEMSVGYGLHGRSACADFLQNRDAWPSDREIMKRTVEVGRVEVKWSLICNNIRLSQPKNAAGAKRVRVCFPKEAWEAVMEAGFEQHPVGKLVGKGTKESRVVFSQLPPEQASSSDKVFYHNHMVDLCRVTRRSFEQKLLLHAQKAQASQSAPQGARAQAQAAEDGDRAVNAALDDAESGDESEHAS